MAVEKRAQALKRSVWGSSLLKCHPLAMCHFCTRLLCQFAVTIERTASIPQKCCEPQRIESSRFCMHVYVCVCTCNCVSRLPGDEGAQRFQLFALRVIFSCCVELVAKGREMTARWCGKIKKILSFFLLKFNKCLI